MSEEKKVMNMASDLYLADWSEQMAQVLKSGLTIEDGLELIRDDTGTDSKEREMLDQMLSEISISGDLAQAMENTGVFPKDMIRMVRLGEQTGNLERILYNLKSQYERQNALRRSIKNAVIYPIGISLVMVALISVILIFVMPVFKRAYASLGIEVTGIAKVLFDLGNWLGSTGLPILIILLIGLFAYLLYQRYRSSKEGGIPFDRMLKDREMLEACKFAGVMALCFSGGITTEEGLEMTLEMNTSPEFSKKISECKSYCEEGARFNEAVRRAGIFNGRMLRRIQMAEKTAEMDVTMQEIADELQFLIDQDIDNRMGRVEPILIGVLTAISALILLSVMLPLLGIMGTL